tara:strand:+ start:175 stop:618 length:444 start_codon:yes stop_codon:yes gene_type:complete
MKLSTALRNHLVVTGSLKAALDGSVIRIYNGTEPTDPDAAVPAASEVLCEISVGGDGTGVTFEQGGSAGLLLKNASEVWTGTVGATSDTATWFRLVAPADDGSASTSAIRVQGTVRPAGGDMQITNPDLVAGAPQNIDYFSLVMPSA